MAIVPCEIVVFGTEFTGGTHAEASLRRFMAMHVRGMLACAAALGAESLLSAIGHPSPLLTRSVIAWDAGACALIGLTWHRLSVAQRAGCGSLGPFLQGAPLPVISAIGLGPVMSVIDVLWNGQLGQSANPSRLHVWLLVSAYLLSVILTVLKVACHLSRRPLAVPGWMKFFRERDC